MTEQLLADIALRENTAMDDVYKPRVLPDQALIEWLSVRISTLDNNLYLLSWCVPYR